MYELYWLEKMLSDTMNKWLNLQFYQLFNRKTVAVKLFFLSLDYVIDLYLDLQYVMLADEKEVYTKMHHKHAAEHRQFTMGVWNLSRLLKKS